MDEKSCASVVQVLLLLCACGMSCDYLQDSGWFTELINGEHFNNLVLNTTQSNELVHTPAVVINYNEQCLAQFNSLGLNRTNVPGARYLVLAVHDHSVRDNCWHDQLDDDRMTSRYDLGTECPEAFYLPRHGSVHFAVPWFSSLDAIRPWIWNRFLIHVTVFNDVSVHLKVYSEGNGPLVKPQELAPSEKIIIKTFVSYTLLAENVATQQKVYGYYINDVNSGRLTLRIGPSSTSDEAAVLAALDRTKAEIDHENDVILQRRHNLAFMYAANFKQPAIVPRFTPNGFEIITETPSILAEHSSIHCKNDTVNNFNYNFSFTSQYEPWVNSLDATLAECRLPVEAKEEIAGVFKSVLKAWAGVSLEFTEMTLIKLSKDSLIRPHVGDVGRHVVSIMALLDIHAENDVKLDLIDFNGKRLQVSLNANTMLVYEAAKVVTGLRSQDATENVTVCWVHFRPAAHWDWRYNGDDITDGRTTESVFSRHTAFTADSGQIWSSLSKHDEL